MSNIKQLLSQIKDDFEREQFIVAQYETIERLNETITELEAEVARLNVLMRQKAPDLVGSDGIIGNGDTPSEQLICLVQLELLNNISLRQELTAEQCKKVEVYSKIIAPYRAKETKKSNPVEEANTADLLRLVQGDE